MTATTQQQCRKSKLGSKLQKELQQLQWRTVWSVVLQAWGEQQNELQ
jgi:hypothetical protein